MKINFFQYEEIIIKLIYFNFVNLNFELHFRLNLFK